MYTMILADVLKRWQTLAGKQALLCTGTDEHGMKVQQAAAVEDVPPMQWCDENAAKFMSLAEVSQIDFDRFIRTTDPDHIDAVKHFWFLLEQGGHIYESKHEGWYCISDECFYPESLIEKTQDPFTGEVFMASSETGNKVEWTEEKNYHFRMTGLKDKLLKFYEENPEWIVPASRMNQVVDWVKNNLEDLSISRPVKRLGWGISVPNDESQTIYVWVDALINYMTFAGFPNWAPGQSQQGGWPADVHVIGKDILRFHCVYWPALLLALDLPLPKKVLSHAHWTMDHRKMSKSIGNVVNPFSAIERFGLDAMRFYMIHDGGISDDADYHNEIIVTRYKKNLQGGVGNLLARITRSKVWNLREAVKAAHDGSNVALTDHPVMEHCTKHIEFLENLVPSVTQKMEKLNPSAALHEIMNAVAEVCLQYPSKTYAITFRHQILTVSLQGNKFITNAAPWDLVKGDDAQRQLGEKVIFLVGETLRMVGILLQPVMPDKATMLLDILEVSPEKRWLENAKFNSDSEYGTSTSGMKGRFGDGTLFPPLAVEE